MASSSGLFAIGVLVGVMAGYLMHGPLQTLFQAGTQAGFGKVGYAYQGSCGCGRH